MRRIIDSAGAHPLASAISVDFLLSLAAVILSTGTMQLLLYPQLALKLGSVGYGDVLTVIGVVNVVTLSLGNNLTNCRIVRQQEYDERGDSGDFQALLILSTVFSAAIVSAYCVLVGMVFIDGISVVVFAVTTVFKSYYLVAFRIVINYKKNLVANVFLCAGYVLGALVLINYVSWPWAFTVANVACIVYVVCVSGIAFEPLRLTRYFGATLKSYAYYVGGGLLGNLGTYLDRFIVSPILGAASVSAYSVAAFFARGVSLAISPLTGVLLSYFAQGRIEINRKRYLLVNLAILVCCVFLFLCSVTFGRWVTEFFYPGIFEEAAPYIVLASAGVVIGVGNSFNGIIVLAVAAPVWQTVIPAVTLAVYFVLAIWLTPAIGLFGICVASIASNSLRFAVNLVLGLRAVMRAGR